MKQKHKGKESKNDERLAKEIQEEEYKKAKIQAERDEEIARKLSEQERMPLLQDNYPPPSFTPVYPPPPSSYSPPNYYNPQSDPYYNPYGYPPPPPSARPRESRPVVQSNVDDSFLPVVNDKCCGINSQLLVLGIAGAMVVGIIVAVVILAAN